MDRLIVTSAKNKLATDILDNEPLAGNVFVYPLHGIKGIAESCY